MCGSRSRTSSTLERFVQIRPGAVEGRHRSDPDSGQDCNEHGELEDASVDADIDIAGQSHRAELSQSFDHP